MGTLKRSSNAKPDFTALQIQTSPRRCRFRSSGANKIAPNLIWFANFRAVPGSSGKGIGGKGGALGAARLAPLTPTPPTSSWRCARDRSTASGSSGKTLGIYVPLELGIGIFNGTTPQVVWPYLAELYPYNALAYQGTAIAWAAGYNLGDAAAVGNHNFEILGPLAGSGVNGSDADPALVIHDFLTNAQYGFGFNPASIDSGSLFTNPDSFQAYCRAMGYAFSPVLSSQEQASSILTRWLQIFSTAAVWSGGLLKFIPYGDTAISQGQANLQHPVVYPDSDSGSHRVTRCRLWSRSRRRINSSRTAASSTPSSSVPLAFIGANIPSVAGEYGMAAPGNLHFRARRPGQAGRHHLHHRRGRATRRT